MGHGTDKTDTSHEALKSVIFRGTDRSNPGRTHFRHILFRTSESSFKLRKYTFPVDTLKSFGASDRHKLDKADIHGTLRSYLRKPGKLTIIDPDDGYAVQLDLQLHTHSLIKRSLHLVQRIHAGKLPVGLRISGIQADIDPPDPSLTQLLQIILQKHSVGSKRKLRL